MIDDAVTTVDGDDPNEDTGEPAPDEPIEGADDLPAEVDDGDASDEED